MAGPVRRGPIRLGIIGAGANVRAKHLPEARSLADVSVTAVANSTPESTQRAARELGIGRMFSRWQDLVADPQVDAVIVGTWPNLHAEVVLAALAAGKHVLTEARMAATLEDAEAMVAASQQAPDLVAQVVPSPFGLTCDRYVRQLVDYDFLGELRELVVLGAESTFVDYTRELHWRQDATRSGINLLTLGILHETAMRWTPATQRVFAQTALFEPTRPAPGHIDPVPVTVPDCAHVLTQLAGGARGLYHISGAIHFGTGKQVHLYGSSGTIKLLCDPVERLYGARRGQSELQELTVPAEIATPWRVVSEFVGAIRGEEQTRRNDFATALRYMQFTAAVHRSAAAGQWIDLPTPAAS